MLAATVSICKRRNHKTSQGACLGLSCYANRDYSALIQIRAIAAIVPCVPPALEPTLHLIKSARVGQPRSDNRLSIFRRDALCDVSAITFFAFRRERRVEFAFKFCNGISSAEDARSDVLSK